jgi:porphobilinogen deaminase
MRLMGAGCSAPVGINAVLEGSKLSLNAVSYGYTPEPRRVETKVDADYTQEEAVVIADYLVGKRDDLL